ncbi:MAG: macro domain-containing protein [Chloroflexota bacterium]
MITYLATDLFQSPAQVLVNAVNTVGVMGKGIALEFKRQYPEMFKQYQVLCKNGEFDMGQLWLYKSPQKWILNFPTKRDWRDKSRIEYVETGLKRFIEIYESESITSISFPRLGCGLGGLNWENEVRPLMEQYLRPLPIDVVIHIPDDAATS